MKLPLTSVTGALQSWYRHETPPTVDWGAIDVVGDPIASAPGWSLLVMTSEKALFKDERELPSYEYFFLLRESARHLLIVSSRQELVEVLVRKLSRFGALAPPVVDIQKLVVDLIEDPGRYSVGGVFARVSGYRSSVESLSIYGNDLASAELFTELLPKLKPYRVQLRDTHSGQNILAVANKGEVSFTYRGVQSLKAIDRTLAFLNTHYVRWPEVRR